MHDIRLSLVAALHRSPAQRALERMRPRLRAAWLTPAALLVAGGFGLALRGHDIAWLAGLVVGVGAGAWLMSRGERSGVSGTAGSVARAETRTARALEPLGFGGWRLLSGIPGPDGILEHIAVGPGGVILLQSLDPDGVVSLRGGQPIVQSHAGGEVHRLRPAVLADAAALRDGVHAVTGRRIWVQPTVVFWSPFPADRVVDGRCAYVHGERLIEWLRRRPLQLAEHEIEAIADDIEQFATASAAAPALARVAAR